MNLTKLSLYADHMPLVVSQVCLVLTLCIAIVSLFVARFDYATIFFAVGHFVANYRENSTDSRTWLTAGCSRDVDNGRWYNFGSPPLFVFYVYSAFLVDHEPHDTIRLISITSRIEHFVSRRLDVFCVVHFSDRHPPHVASILHRPPKRILTPGVAMGYEVGDYVYSCPLSEHQRNRVPVSIVQCCIHA